jgi:glycosyltransferase involved in cell wall biosynthesis
VSDAGRRALLDGAAMLAYPSIYEGFGFPVLEAMTVGVPVVAARAGAIPEVAGDAALLVEPTDEANLAAAIAALLADEGLRRELIARGRDRVREFSWEDTALAFATCYRRLAESVSR